MRNPLYLALLLALPLTAAAEEITTQPTYTVTATRRSQTVQDTLASVSVITRADIEASHAPTLLELLRSQPGVDFSRTGGVGQSTSILLRGAKTGHTLVLIDGVRVASAMSGVFDFAHLPLDQIERIEIVRGPRAAYWGSDAIGGVIQIFTRTPAGPSLQLEGGRYKTLGGSASYGLGDQQRGFGATLGGMRSDGFSAQNPFGFGYNPDNDGYINRNASLNGRYQIGEQRLSAHAIATNADVEFDQGRTEAKNHSLGAQWSGAISDSWTHALSVGSAYEALRTPAFQNLLYSRRESLDWVNEVRLSPVMHASFGLNYQHERGVNHDLITDSDYYTGSRHNSGVFGAFGGENALLDYDLSARYDHYQGFGGKATGAAAIGHRFECGVRTFASVGQGYRAPTFSELFDPGFFGQYAGNPDLDPERSTSGEIGVEGPLGDNQNWSANVYDTRVRDLIGFVGPNQNAINIGKARLRGVELAYTAHWNDWQLGVNATIQHTEDESTGEPLKRRPIRKGSANLSYAISDTLSVGAEIFGASRRQDFGKDPGGYAVSALRVDWTASPHLRFGARLDNAFDHDYELAAGYNTPGRSAWFTVEVK